VSEDRPQKISIAFQGGQVLSARVPPKELARFRAALGSVGWHEVAAEDGTIVLDLGRIDYLLVDEDEHRVGF